VYTRAKPRSSTSEEEAQGLAIEALTWLGEDAERLQRFLALSGLGPQNLRSAAAESGFLGAVLDHLAGNEALLLAFAARRRVAPEAVMEAQALLNGKEAQHDS
jgi:hypothetical protein